MINKRVYLALAVLMTSAAPASAAVSLAGTWNVSSGGVNNPTGGPKPVCTLTLKGAAVSGTCKAPVHEGPVSGTLTGDKLVLAWTATDSVSSRRFDFTGQWDTKDKITGKLTWVILSLRPGVNTTQPPPEPINFVATRVIAPEKK